MKKLYTVTTHRSKDGGGTEDQQTVFSYDLMGRLTNVWFPDGSYPNGSHEDTTYEFGQLKSWRTRKGQLKTIVYDARGREQSHSWSDQSGACNPGTDTAETPCIARSWDDANRLTSITNKWSSIDFAYDDAGQVISEGDEIAGSGGRTQTNYYRYPNGTVAHLHYPGGTFVRQDYTSRGQLAATGWDDDDSNWWMKLAAYTYLSDGRVDKVDYGNGMTTDPSYDQRGFIQYLDHYNVSSNLHYSWRQYWRDNRDRITAFQKSYNPSANPMEDGRGDRYAYDNEGQVTDAWYDAIDPHGATSGWARRDHFDYDALGNRQGSNNNVASRSSGSTPITFNRRDNGVNQYSSWTPSIIYHDDNYPGWSPPGNGVTMAEGWITASYNALNQPIAIWSPTYNGTSNFMWFGYDPLARCVKRWVGDSGGIYSNPATYLHYDGSNLLQEGANAWGPTRVYVHGNRVDEIVWSYNTFTGEQAFHHYDARGHATLLTDSASNILEQYEYDAFGQPYFYDANGNSIGAYDAQGRWAGYSLFGNRFLFTGREWLSDVKLYDYRNRMYQPELGRFLQPDPKEFAAGDYNLYRYCHNDPVNNSDPMGLYVYSLTSTGGGDWIGRPDGLTNRDVHLLNEGRIVDTIRSFERNMSLQPGGSSVKWSGRVNQIHDPSEKFGDGVIAFTKWAVSSKASSQNSRITGFKNELAIDIHWNDSSDARSQLMAQNMVSPRGEFAHANDAFRYGWHGGQYLTPEGRRRSFSSASVIANNAARTMIDSSIPEAVASKQMEEALQPWVEGSRAASKQNHDPPWSNDHGY
ncbi:MAG: hypothetical protein V7609_871 [Verrucomicrobiota bacterium]